MAITTIRQKNPVYNKYKPIMCRIYIYDSYELVYTFQYNKY